MSDHRNVTGNAKVDFDDRRDVLVVQGFFEADKPGGQEEDGLSGQEKHRPRELQYTLVVKRTGGGGTARTRQSGVFTPTAGMTDTLSSVSIRTPSSTRVEGELRITDGATTVDAAHRTWTGS